LYQKKKKNFDNLFLYFLHHNELFSENFVH